MSGGRYRSLQTPQPCAFVTGCYEYFFGEVLPNSPLTLMSPTKEPPDSTAAPSEVHLREKYELGAAQEGDHNNDTLVDWRAKRTGDATTEERGKNDDTPDSDSTPTGSSDEFDWDKDEDDASSKGRNDHAVKAKRGRAAYLAFIRLARPLRVALLCILGGGILITPLLIVQFVFNSNPVKKHVFAWSIWLTIVWVAGCLTYVVVDAFGWVFLGLVSLFGGKTESLQMQLEVCRSLMLTLFCFCVRDAYRSDTMRLIVDDCSLRLG